MSPSRSVQPVARLVALDMFMVALPHRQRQRPPRRRRQRPQRRQRLRPPQQGCAVHSVLATPTRASAPGLPVLAATSANACQTRVLNCFACGSPAARAAHELMDFILYMDMTLHGHGHDPALMDWPRTGSFCFGCWS